MKVKVLHNDTWVHPEAKLKAKPRAKAKASHPKVAEATFERSMLSKQMIHMLDGTTMMRLKMSNGSSNQRKKSEGGYSCLFLGYTSIGLEWPGIQGWRFPGGVYTHHTTQTVGRYWMCPHS